MIASSLGGYVASRFTELNPEVVDSLILLAPAFNIEKGLSMGIDIQKWEKEGEIGFFNHKLQGVHNVKVGFYRDLQTHPAFPMPSACLSVATTPKKCKVTIIHGTEDKVVPSSMSNKFLDEVEKRGFNKESVKLIFVEDGHELVKSETLALLETLVSDNWMNATISLD